MQFVDDPDDGVEQVHQEIHDVGQPQEVFPMGGADGLGHDFREHQDEDGHDGADDAEPMVSGQEGGLMAHGGCTQRVGDGVQGKDGA